MIYLLNYIQVAFSFMCGWVGWASIFGPMNIMFVTLLQWKIVKYRNINIKKWQNMQNKSLLYFRSIDYSSNVYSFSSYFLHCLKKNILTDINPGPGYNYRARIFTKMHILLHLTWNNSDSICWRFAIRIDSTIKYFAYFYIFTSKCIIVAYF